MAYDPRDFLDVLGELAPRYGHGPVAGGDKERGFVRAFVPVLAELLQQCFRSCHIYHVADNGVTGIVYHNFPFHILRRDDDLINFCPMAKWFKIKGPCIGVPCGERRGPYGRHRRCGLSAELAATGVWRDTSSAPARPGRLIPRKKINFFLLPPCIRFGDLLHLNPSAAGPGLPKRRGQPLFPFGMIKEK